MRRYFTTIVGGRPEGESDSPKIPRGWEVLLKKARVDTAFRERFLADPVSAANEIELALSAGEEAMIRSWNPAVLARLIEKTRVPEKQVGVFRFGSTAAMLAVVAAAAVVSPTETAANAGSEAYEEYNDWNGGDLFATVEYDADTTVGQLGLIQTALEVYFATFGHYVPTEQWYMRYNAIAEILELFSDSAPFLFDDVIYTFRYMGVVEDGRVANYRLESADGRVSAPIDPNLHQFTGEGPLAIIQPSENDRLRSPFGSDRVRVKFEAEHSQDDAVVNWCVEGSVVETTTGNHVFRAWFYRGLRHVVAVDQNGHSSLVTFTVEEG